MLIRTLIVLALFAGVLPLVHRSTVSAVAPGAANEPCTPGVALLLGQVVDPSVSVNPVRGPAGTRAELALRNFVPNQEVRAIFRAGTDPVVATGTVGANGRLILDFTVPQVPDGTYWILVAQNQRDCIHASVRFTVGAVTPTPTRTATPIPTATPQPPAPTATVTTVAPTATPTPIPPTPRPPIAGAGSEGTSGFNPGVLTLAFLAVSGAFAYLAIAGHASRRAGQRARRR